MTGNFKRGNRYDSEIAEQKNADVIFLFYKIVEYQVKFKECVSGTKVSSESFICRIISKCAKWFGFCRLSSELKKKLWKEWYDNCFRIF